MKASSSCSIVLCFVLFLKHRHQHYHTHATNTQNFSQNSFLLSFMFDSCLKIAEKKQKVLPFYDVRKLKVDEVSSGLAYRHIFWG